LSSTSFYNIDLNEAGDIAVAVDSSSNKYIALIKFGIEPSFNATPILINFFTSEISNMRGIKRILGNSFLISSYFSSFNLYLLEIDPVTLTLVRLEAYSNFFPSSTAFWSIASFQDVFV
jgi:hypothetical protein